MMSATILEEAVICFFWGRSGFLRAWNILTIAFREKGMNEENHLKLKKNYLGKTEPMHLEVLALCVLTKRRSNCGGRHS